MKTGENLSSTNDEQTVVLLAQGSMLGVGICEKGTRDLNTQTLQIEQLWSAAVQLLKSQLTEHGSFEAKLSHSTEEVEPCI